MSTNKELLYCDNFCSDVSALLEAVPSEQLFIVADEGSAAHCLPLLRTIPCLQQAPVKVIPSGDEFKNVDTVVSVWDFLLDHEATRNSWLINIGGGMVTDLGGFAANTFKRGIAFINIPTTLLAMVDAAVGGKTGINFRGLKNEIGIIHPAQTVIIYAGFLQTLDRANLLSGYAEMLKHALLSDEKDVNELLAMEFSQPDYTRLGSLVAQSVAVKQAVVEQDPTEQGIRKALNLGHTVGHALESYSHQAGRPLLHGIAVAMGLIAELYLSYRIAGFPQDTLLSVVQYIREQYPPFLIDCHDYEALYQRMLHDKKNQRAGQVVFTLLSAVGKVEIDCVLSKEQIFEALDFYRES